MGQQVDSEMMGMMGRDMAMNMMGQDRTSQMIGHNMMSHQDMTPNMMYSDMMGQDMMDVSNRNQIFANMKGNSGMSSNMMNSRSNKGLMGQRMMQKMEIDHVPETYTSTRFLQTH